ncbi:MAG: nicotinamide-nucleotide adenylyltransferase [Candidatus Aenigmarchaeota archaeon]|nr:nicotinamide-nucleotide adenylyltransferase [Candidatus Aenigmarchaeota archaeon]
MMLSKKQKNSLRNGRKTEKNRKIAFYPGRFQPFHKGHLSAIRWILKNFDFVIIGVGSSQESRTKKNPFSFDERKKMIEKTLKAHGIKKSKYKIVPIPDFFDDEKWSKYCMKNFKFDVVVTGSRWTARCFKNKRPVRRVKFFKRNMYRATLIRRMILKKDNKWKQLVPVEVYNYLIEINVCDVLKKSSSHFQK